MVQAIQYQQQQRRRQLKRRSIHQWHQQISVLLVLRTCITALSFPIITESFRLVAPYACSFSHSYPPHSSSASASLIQSNHKLPSPLAATNNPNNNGISLDNEEPLSVLFDRAVCLQRAGDHLAALNEYEMFIKAAKQCDVSPKMYAEVHVNIGAVHVKNRQPNEAKYHFEEALRCRTDLATAHVNLALLALSKGTASRNPSLGIAALKEAKTHCQHAILIDKKKEDYNSYSVQTATRLLSDIDRMLASAGE